MELLSGVTMATNTYQSMDNQGVEPDLEPSNIILSNLLSKFNKTLQK